MQKIFFLILTVISINNIYLLSADHHSKVDLISQAIDEFLIRMKSKLDLLNDMQWNYLLLGDYKFTDIQSIDIMKFDHNVSTIDFNATHASGSVSMVWPHFLLAADVAVQGDEYARNGAVNATFHNIKINASATMAMLESEESYINIELMLGNVSKFYELRINDKSYETLINLALKLDPELCGLTVSEFLTKLVNQILFPGQQYYYNDINLQLKDFHTAFDDFLPTWL